MRMLAGAFLLLLTMGTPVPSLGTPAPPFWDTGVIQPNGSLYKDLSQKGISSQRIHMITSMLSPHVDLRKIQPGSPFRVSLDRSGKLQEFMIAIDRDTVCRIDPDGRGWYTASKKPWNKRLETAMISGEIQTTVEAAMAGAGEAEELATLFREVLASNVEAPAEIETGRQFKLVVEKIFADDKLMQYGEIKAFLIRKGEKVISGFRYGGSYYDEKGDSLGRQFLRVPLDYHYVSSEFMKRRKHPILGGVRPHYGIDFVAPVGTPVWSVADGEVVSCGWKGGLGFAVQVRHEDGYETIYGHLNRFAQGIREGARVRQRQMIGYIGITGLSTGPHLHYGLTRDGKPRNPLLEHFPRGKITGAAHIKTFLEEQKIMLALLEEPRQVSRVSNSKKLDSGSSPE